MLPNQARCIFALALMTGCAQLPAARMERPAELDTAQALVMHGLPRGDAGRFAFDAFEVRFNRHQHDSTWLGAATLQRATLDLAWTRALGDEQVARCQSRALELGGGSLMARAHPVQLSCQGTAGTLVLTEQVWPLTRVRQGAYEAGALTLQLQSVHRLQGSPLTQQQPTGYLMRHQGRVVAALDLASGKPRLLRAELDPALQRACAEAAVLLALSAREV